MGWRSAVFLHGRKHGRGGRRRHVWRYRTDSKTWRRWRRNAKRRGKRIQNARGKRHTTVRAVVVHLRKLLMAIGAMDMDSHTHFAKRHAIHDGGMVCYINTAS